MATVAFHTLGCKVNHYETEAIWQLLKKPATKEKNLKVRRTYTSLIHAPSQIRVIKEPPGDQTGDPPKS